MTIEDVALGSEYVDRISGLTGIATAKCTYLSGEANVQLTPRVDKDGKAPPKRRVDVERLSPRKA